MNDEKYLKGRGSQINTHNRFLTQRVVREHWEGIDEVEDSDIKTEIIEVFPKTIINKVESLDIGAVYSMNPYQGCEHGCIYCYARNSHEYWGYSAGLDFERKILVKKNAPELLEQTFKKKNYEPCPIMFSGNTDCYQPVERKLEITRKMLEVCLKYKHPVSMITKNSLILRDLDIISEMAKLGIIHVSISLTTLNEDLRRAMEPRTASATKKLETIRILSTNGVPVNVMMAPVIPALNSSEIPEVAKKVAEAGAIAINYTMVRLNGQLPDLFTDWVKKNFPDRAEKVLNQIKECHGGQLNDSRPGIRMRGEGVISKQINDLFRIARQQYFANKKFPKLKMDLFDRNAGDKQMRLF